MIGKEIKQLFYNIVGPAGYCDGAGGAAAASSKIAKYCSEPRGRFAGRPSLLLMPDKLEQICQIMRLCSSYKIAVTPQGGNSGLVGAQQTDQSQSMILLSFERFNKLRDIDKLGNYICVEAGMVLSDLQNHAAEINRFFPLSLASQMSCQIGGNLATNAGGVAVLTYGNMRELCLGLELVLADGTLVRDLRSVKKDNSGYSLKDLFIGSEGTLGLITAASLKLFPRPKARQSLYVALSDIKYVLEFFSQSYEILGPLLIAFEFLPRNCLALAWQYAGRSSAALPFRLAENYYILMEIISFKNAQDARHLAEDLLSTAWQKSLIKDGLIAKNDKENALFWHWREIMSPAQKLLGASIKHDISLPLRYLEVFLSQAQQLVLKAMPGASIIAFGHIGDGNLHYNISQPASLSLADFWHQAPELSAKLYDLVMGYNGSFSAEHGIGQLKIKEMERYKCPNALKLMRKIKNSFDPLAIMNPGKIFAK